MCTYNLDDEFDQLFQDVELEDDSDAVIGAEEALTNEDTLCVAAVEGSEGVAIDGAGSCHKPILVSQHSAASVKVKFSTIEKGVVTDKAIEAGRAVIRLLSLSTSDNEALLEITQYRFL